MSLEMSALEHTKKKKNKSINYYSVLGVSSTVSDLELKNAFEELSKRYQSRGSSDPQLEETNPRLALINEAYAIISNPETRRNYDDELKSILAMDDISQRGSFIIKLSSQLKIFGRYFRYALILVSVILLLFVISFFTYVEISNPYTRIKGIQDGLLLYSLMSFFLLIISYYKDVPSRVRAWFRVISICILTFCFIVAFGLFVLPAAFSLSKNIF